MKAGEVELLCEILRGAPAMPRALCGSRPELFDVDNDQDTTDRAQQLCTWCPDVSSS